MRSPELRSTPRILLVDDDPQLLELGAQTMKLCGYSVVTASDPIEAASMKADEKIEKIDIAILDYNMPAMNGCFLATRLRSLYPEMKIILFSGAVDILKTR